jgi:hypothetical protein
MKNTLLLILISFYILPALAQSNELLLKKKSKTIETFFVGKYITLETVRKILRTGS